MEDSVIQQDDLYAEYDEAISHFDKVRVNPACTSIEVKKLQKREDCSLLECVEVLASHSIIVIRYNDRY